jgi:hypothetical protein
MGADVSGYYISNTGNPPPGRKLAPNPKEEAGCTIWTAFVESWTVYWMDVGDTDFLLRPQKGMLLS